jgi:hypothetical protein
MAKKNATPASEAQAIELPRLKIAALELTLVGDSPLICHRWSEKAKKQMLDRQMKKAKGAKEAKDPQKDYEESLYKMPDGKGYGFPTVAFKAAAVDAAAFVDGAKKTMMRGCFHVEGELARVEGTPSMREDMCRVGMGVADLRYRGEFKNWKTKLRIRYNASAISAEQIVNLFQTAGFAIGVGEWRPQKDGSYGMFHPE